MNRFRASFGVMLATTVVAGTSLLLSAFTPAAPDKAIMTRGEKVYKGYCMTCHQANGNGMGTIYPPLAKSDYLTQKSKSDVIRAVVFGLSGKIKVNGKNYNGVMTPMPGNYTNDDIAAVMTYIYNSWGNKGGAVTAADVVAAKKLGKLK